jgi:putative spermidine/putrescine transport system permease protein
VLRSPLITPALLLGPACTALLLVFVLPIGLLLSRSLFDPDFTLRHYARAFAIPEYLRVFWISFEIAGISTLVGLLLGYPLAYYISRSSPSARSIAIGIVLLPFWTNILVRCYAWMLILQTKGLLNLALVDWLELIPRPVPMVYNLTGVIVGMVHYLLPPTVLILDSVMRTIDRRLLAAAESLGAKPFQVFWRIFFPLSIPGVRAAALLIFIMGLGFFVTPALLGGRTDITVAMLINAEFTELVNWGFGSALAVILLVVTLVGVYGYYLAQPRQKLATFQ